MFNRERMNRKIRIILTSSRDIIMQDKEVIYYTLRYSIIHIAIPRYVSIVDCAFII